MTITEASPVVAPAVSFRRTILVGVDDPMLDGAPATTSLTVPDVVAPAAPPAPPLDGQLPRTRLVAAAFSIVLLVAAVAAMAWFRFADAPRVPGSAGPVPGISLTVPSDAAMSVGAPVTVDLAAVGGTAVTVDLFVDGDWTGSDDSAPYTPDWEHRSAGTHELKAKITDADGKVRYSDAISVTITE